MSDPLLVVDASALVLAVVADTPAGSRVRDRLRRSRVHAPHLVDAEVGHVLRRQVLRGELGAEQAGDCRRFAEAIVEERHDHTGPLAAWAWANRDRLSFYDALFAGLAALLECPLLTVDLRLRRGASPDVEIAALSP